MKNQPVEWVQRCSLRIYVPLRQPIPGANFWQRHVGPSLGQTLLQRAKAAGLGLALLLPVEAGYVAEGSISHHFSEGPPPGHPLCLEIVDTYKALMDYVEANRLLLADATLVLHNPETFQRI